jgi:hypothetical protein
MHSGKQWATSGSSEISLADPFPENIMFFLSMNILPSGSFKITA